MSDALFLKNLLIKSAAPGPLASALAAALSAAVNTTPEDVAPYVSLSGLTRLTHHALRTYLARQPLRQKEEYPRWRSELPGTITMKMAPQYWIWRAEGSIGESAHFRFNGVVAHFIEASQSCEPKITDLRDLIGKIESTLGQTDIERQKSLLGIYVLWNTVIEESAKSPNREAIVTKYSELLHQCGIQNFAVEVILDNNPVSWSGQECENCLIEYERRRYKPSAVALPRRLEIALAAETGNRFLDAGDQDRFCDWMSHAMTDAAGMTELQDHIRHAMSSKCRMPTRQLLGFPATASGGGGPE